MQAIDPRKAGQMVSFDASQFFSSRASVGVYAIADGFIEIDAEVVVEQRDGGVVHARLPNDGELPTGTAVHTALEGTVVHVRVAEFGEDGS